MAAREIDGKAVVAIFHVNGEYRSCNYYPGRKTMAYTHNVKAENIKYSVESTVRSLRELLANSNN